MSSIQFAALMSRSIEAVAKILHSWLLKQTRHIRFERSRKKAGNPQLKTPDQFLEEEARELSSSNPANQQLDATLRAADITVTNNGSLEDLHRKLDELCRRLCAIFSARTGTNTL